MCNPLSNAWIVIILLCMQFELFEIIPFKEQGKAYISWWDSSLEIAQIGSIQWSPTLMIVWYLWVKKSSVTL